MTTSDAEPIEPFLADPVLPEQYGLELLDGFDSKRFTQNIRLLAMLRAGQASMTREALDEFVHGTFQI